MHEDNPFWEGARRHAAYGQFAECVPGFLAEVPHDPEERVISAVKCNHGNGSVGYLTQTTHNVWYFQRLLFKKYEKFPFAIPMAVRGPFPQVIVLGDGSLFQNRGLRNGAFNGFVDLHQRLVEAAKWEDEHAAVEPIPVVIAGGSGLADQLARLHELRSADAITADEYEAAKTSVLKMGA